MPKSNRSLGRVILLGITLFIAATSWAEKPRVLIVQSEVQTKDVEAVALESILADELDRVGQVTAITWSLTDPIVRELDGAGKLRFRKIQSEDESHDAAREVGANYLLLVAAIKDAGRVRPFAKLSRVGSKKPMWTFGNRDWADPSREDREAKDPGVAMLRQSSFDDLEVRVNGATDWDGSARNVAIEWAERLAKGPFKKLRRNPRIDLQSEVVASPGLLLPAIEPGSFQNYLASVPVETRITVLRDAIDREPDRGDLRVSLFDNLMRSYDFEAAAHFASQASDWSKGAQDWHLRAAQAYIQSNDVANAKMHADLAGATSVANPQSARLIGDIRLSSGDYSGAVEAYRRAIDARPSPEAIIGRAVANALLCDDAAVEADLQLLVDSPGARAAETYRLAVLKIRSSMNSIAVAISELIPHARLAPGAPQVIAKAQTFAVRSASLSKLLSKLPPPTTHQKSHAELDLACKLLDQTSQETLEFSKSSDEEVGAEASLSLNEAFASIRLSGQIFEAESRRE